MEPPGGWWIFIISTATYVDIIAEKERVSPSTSYWFGQGSLLFFQGGAGEPAL
jgi:hypothetical protein